MVRNSYEFLDLAASAVPASSPKPQFEGGDEIEPNAKGSDDLLNNWQFMVLGAILGVLATVIYYQVARFAQQYRQSRIVRITDLESHGDNQHPLEDPNKYLFRKVFKEDASESEK